MLCRSGLVSLLIVLACTPESKNAETGTVNSPDSGTSDTSTEDSSTPTDTEETDEPAVPFEDCLDELQEPLTWFTETNPMPFNGDVWFGHTHVTKQDETRWSPKPPAFRDTILLFEPATSVDQNQELRIVAMRGQESLGVLSLQPPEDSPTILEQGLTSESLEPWSSTAWSVLLPWSWMEEGIELKLGYVDSSTDVFYEHSTTLTDLGAPHRFTVSRSKIVLFGDESFDTTTYTAEQIGKDFFSVLPISDLAWVDSTNWVLDEIVVRGADGPVKVSSEAQRLAETSDPDRWGILKNIFTHRLSLANTGKGLSNTTFSGGNSPYSFGTTLGMGWVVDENGNYVDINNAPYSAGWTGWSSIWHGECGNVFNHEIGHSFTLEHFVEGTANNWGLADQYPDDGVNLETHPWGYDTVHNQFRSWYRVNNDGIVYREDGSIQGKRDSMNGGESSNSLHCFPQYTGYHAWKIQNWMETTPTLAQNGANGAVVQWNEGSNTYISSSMEYDYEIPMTTGSPVVTIVGALADTALSPDANHIYPPVFWDAGNAFPLPDPTQTGLNAFDGANYVAEITNVDGIISHALINKSTMTGTDLNLFSFNIPLQDNPVQVKLLHSETPYPNIDLSNATVLATRDFEPPPQLPKASIIGRQTLHTGKLTLTSWCEEGINCDAQSASLLWSDSEPLSFHKGFVQTEECAEADSVTTFTIDVINEDGVIDTLTLHGQRIVDDGSQTWTVAMNDSTPWSTRPNLRQTVRVWIPYEANGHLTAGSWQSIDGTATLSVQSGNGDTAIDVGSVAIDVSLTIEPTTLMSLNDVIESTPISLEDSSLYFVVTDDAIGPTSREWWGSNTFTPLSVPMMDQDTGETTTVTVHSYKQTCNLGWGTLWTLNSGQVADPCTYQVRLEMPDTGNEHLTSGHTYRSLGSQPVIFEGRRWHGPNATGLEGRFVWQLEYVAP